MASPNDDVKAAFLAVHNGRSTDDVVIDPNLNQSYLLAHSERNSSLSSQEANWRLMNLRKASGLGGVTTVVERLDHSSYVHASEIAARLMEDRFDLTVDRVLCDPNSRGEFDRISRQIAPDISNYRLRKAALGLRKAKKLQPEVVKRVAAWEVEIIEYSADKLLVDLDLIPSNPGIYIFLDPTGYLYLGESANLRLRVAKHLDHSDRKSLARYFWDEGFSEIKVQIHVFDPNSDAKKQSMRRAYESDLLAKRSVRFNIRS
jgi:hypothetical protein